jgi:prepilin peptidase CpaA
VSPSHVPDIYTVALLLPFLAAAAGTDLLNRRIPNVLIVLMLGFGIALQGMSLSFGAVLWSLGGVLVGFLMLLPFYALGGMGAGDVKLLAAVGSFLGPYGALLAGLFTLIAGGVLGVAMLVGQRIEDWRARRSPLPQERGEHSKYLPYSLAISAGTLTAVLQW